MQFSVDIDKDRDQLYYNTNNSKPWSEGVPVTNKVGGGSAWSLLPGVGVGTICQNGDPEVRHPLRWHDTDRPQPQRAAAAIGSTQQNKTLNPHYKDKDIKHLQRSPPLALVPLTVIDGTNKCNP